MGEHWQLFLFLAGLIAAWSLFMLGIMRSMLTRLQGDIEQKIAGLSASAGEAQRVDRDLMKLKAALPLEYVRREDHIRDMSVMYVKIDHMSDKLDEIGKLLAGLISQKKEG